MKKIAFIIAGTFLFATLTYAQSPQAKETTKNTKTENTKKESKEGCDKKDTKNCADKQSGKSCCSHGTDSKKETSSPDKK